MPLQFSLRRRRLFLLAASIFCIFSVHSLRKTLWNTSEAGLEAFKDENDDCGRFESHSPYRKDPDYDFEQRIDSALLAIQRREKLKSLPNIPVKKIWQTWRDKVVPEDFDQPAVWRNLHPGWEYNVWPQVGCGQMLANM
jgi:mannosyltransferase OCH1-like enzyme